MSTATALCVIYGALDRARIPVGSWYLLGGAGSTPSNLCRIRNRQIGSRKCLSQSISVVPFPLILPIFHIFVSPHTRYVDQDSSVGIASRYGLDGLRIKSWLGVRFSTPLSKHFNLYKRNGTHPIQCASCTSEREKLCPTVGI
jgi:hypothetical protein